MLLKASTHRVCIALLAGCLSFAMPSVIHASGSYTFRPSRPALQSVDAELYEVGKNIFAGKTKLNEAAPAKQAEQKGRLTELQSKLPTSALKSANLTDMAGKLTAEQLDALEYYVKTRYKIK